MLGYACLKFIEMLRRKCLSKSMTNIFGNLVSHQGPRDEGVLFPLLTSLQDGSTVTALQLASNVLYNWQPLGSVTVKRDEEEEVMVKICNQVLANTPIHQEPLGRAWYTTPRTFSYGEQMKRLEKCNSKFKQMMAPFQATATGKMQNKWPSDVVDRSHSPHLTELRPAAIMWYLLRNSSQTAQSSWMLGQKR